MNASARRAAYDRIVQRLGALPAQAPRDERMRALCDAVWEELSHTAPAPGPYSWIGFYEIAPSGAEMSLGPRRDSPACSPIGLHGACGRAWRERRALVIPDIATLGEGYIACDPRDRAEVVVPLFAPDGACWGVLDGDSHSVGAFDETDALGLTRAVIGAGLSPPDIDAPTARM